MDMIGRNRLEQGRALTSTQDAWEMVPSLLMGRYAYPSVSIAVQHV